MSGNSNKNNINIQIFNMTINPILIVILIVLIVIFVVLANYIFASTSSKSAVTVATSKKEVALPKHLESNKNAIDIVQVLRENAGEVRRQEDKVE